MITTNTSSCSSLNGSASYGGSPCASASYEFYHADRQGNVIAMANSAGTMTAQYVYTPYGVEEPYNNSGNPYRYTGRRLEAEWGIFNYRARYYDPALGRFYQTDPVLYADQFNLYAYVGNNPLNATDPSGLCFQRSQGVSASNPGCRITGRSGARSDSRYNGGVQQISSSARLIAHSLLGGGAAAQFDISRHPGAISQAEARIMRSASGGDAGSFSRAIAAAISTGDAQSIDTTLGGLQTGVVGVGQATFTLQGTLTVDGDEWRFVGEITGTGEQFDFNEKPIGERAAGAEAATRVGSAVGASEYSVEYLGTFQVEAAGEIPKVTCTGSRIQRTER